MKRRLYLLCGTALLLLMSGCMGYRLGANQPEGIHTVALAPVINRTGEPAVEQQVTHALRERIQFDGRLKLVDLQAAPDAIIEVSLTEYDLLPIAYRDLKSSTPQLYRLTLKGKAALKEAQTENAISSSETYGDTPIPFQSDLTLSKRDGLPAAAAEFAKHMISDLLDVW